MTTRVQISLPVPSHHRAKVTAYYVNADGSLGPEASSVVLDHGQSTADLYVHGAMKIVITET